MGVDYEVFGSIKLNRKLTSLEVSRFSSDCTIWGINNYDELVVMFGGKIGSVLHDTDAVLAALPKDVVPISGEIAYSVDCIEGWGLIRPDNFGGLCEIVGEMKLLNFFDEDYKGEYDYRNYLDGEEYSFKSLLNYETIY